MIHRHDEKWIVVTRLPSQIACHGWDAILLQQVPKPAAKPEMRGAACLAIDRHAANCVTDWQWNSASPANRPRIRTTAQNVSILASVRVIVGVPLPRTDRLDAASTQPLVTERDQVLGSAQSVDRHAAGHGRGHECLPGSGRMSIISSAGAGASVCQDRFLTPFAPSGPGTDPARARSTGNLTRARCC